MRLPFAKMLSSVLPHRISRDEFWKMTLSEYTAIVGALNEAQKKQDAKPEAPSMEAHLANKKAFEKLEAARLARLKEKEALENGIE